MNAARSFDADLIAHGLTHQSYMVDRSAARAEAGRGLDEIDSALNRQLAGAHYFLIAEHGGLNDALY